MRYIIGLLLTTSCLIGSNCVSTVAGGNWSSTGTWTSCAGGVPGAGDQAQILGPVTVDTNTTVGTDGATSEKDATNYAILISYTNTTTNKGVLTVGNSVTLTARGDIRLLGSSTATVVPTFNMGAGSKLVFDSSNGANPDTYHYRIYTASSSGHQKGQVNIVGTSGSHAMFDTVTTSRVATNGVANNHLFIEQSQSGATIGLLDVVIQYADIEDCGSQQLGCLQSGPSGTTTPSQFKLEHVTMTRTSGIKCVSLGSCSGPSATADYILRDVKFYNTTTVGSASGYTDSRSKYSFNINTSANKSTGTREITDVYFDAGASSPNNGWPGFVLTNVVYEIDPPASAPATTSTNAVGQMTNVVYRLTNWGGNAAPLAGSATNLYFFMESSASATNPHGLQMVVRGDQTLDGGIFEYGGNPGSGPDGNILTASMFSAGVSNFTHTIQNTIVTPVTGTTTPVYSGGNLGNFNSQTDNPVIPDTVIYKHNTYFLFGSAATGTNYFGEAMNSCADSHYGATAVDVFRDNVGYNIGASTAGNGLWEMNECATTAPPNMVDPAGADHNACVGCTATGASAWTTANATNCPVSCTSNSTFYDIPMTVTTPGTGDISSDPGFVDLHRSIRRWCDSVNGYAAETCGGQEAVQYLRDGPGTMQSKIDALFAWVRAGFKPTNAAYRTAASDGTTIGAVAMDAAAPPAYKPVPRKPASRVMPKKEYHFMWVNNLNTQAAVDTVVADAIRIKVNAVYIQFQPNHNLNYRSCTGSEPINSGLTSGFDSMEYAIAQFHANDIEVWSWQAMNYAAGSYAESQPANNVWTLHGISKNGTADDWMNKRSDLANTTAASPGIFFDPGIPDFLTWISNFSTAYLACYNIDGIAWDYMRYPYLDGSLFSGYSPTNITRFNRATGGVGTPTETDSAWQDWRREQVINELEQSYFKAKELKPNIKMGLIAPGFGGYSGANAPSGENFARTDLSLNNRPEPYRNVFADWHTLMVHGTVDVLSPFFYRNQTTGPGTDFIPWMQWLADEQKVHKVVSAPGLGFAYNSVAEIQTQLPLAMDTGLKGYTIWRYGCFIKGTTSSACDGDNTAAMDAYAAQYPVKPDIPDMPWLTFPKKGNLIGDIVVGGGGASNLNDRLTVTITNLQDGTSTSTLTHANGFWGVKLNPGSYSISIAGTGITTYTATDLQVNAGRTTRADATVTP